MKDNILFLGTSHGDPSLTRFCSSTLYTIGGTRILVDAGDPASALLVRQGIKPSQLDAVFMTHMHIDHANGLSCLLYQTIKYPQNRVEMFFADPSSVEPFLQWNRAMFNYEIKDECVAISSVTPEMIWQKNGITIRPIPTDHMHGKSPSYAYCIETPQSRIIHTGDLTADFHDFPVHPGDPVCDLCVCEATHIWYYQKEFVEKLAQAPVKKLILNHIGPHWTDGQESSLRELVSELPYPAEIAFDGMTVAI